METIADALGQVADANGAPKGVSARPTGNRQQPGTGGCIASEVRQGGEGPQVGRLGQVVGVLVADQVRAEAPHLGLGASHKAGERRLVPPAGVERQTSDLVHGAQSCRVWLGVELTSAERRLFPHGLHHVS